MFSHVEALTGGEQAVRNRCALDKRLCAKEYQGSLTDSISTGNQSPRQTSDASSDSGDVSSTGVGSFVSSLNTDSIAYPSSPQVSSEEDDDEDVEAMMKELAMLQNQQSALTAEISFLTPGASSGSAACHAMPLVSSTFADDDDDDDIDAMRSEMAMLEKQLADLVYEIGFLTHVAEMKQKLSDIEHVSALKHSITSLSFQVNTMQTQLFQAPVTQPVSMPSLEGSVSRTPLRASAKPFVGTPLRATARQFVPTSTWK